MAAILSLIEFQLKNAQELTEVLEQERAAIANRVSKDIEAIAKKKIVLIEQLQTTDERLRRHPEVDNLSSDPELSPLVDQIRALVSDCQQANEVNGQALQRAQLSFNKLNNLMQQSQGKLGMTYTAEGQTKNVTTLGTNLKA
ncbi:flagellar export chaperone FlgN [Vibrio europaeus]|uniref:Flagellar export chaperone FlgN n=1 Tax=Vibrio europaeus TaxID=300876 RepID=A0A178JGT1_9VIBR|nr:flagellar export chaperone FlgN [Vibrio europaeus]MDC5704564.1 flagellar export chaperone FlgN [Vibrio europaeus]MDC5712084.1 flagellar export chaperone FlgN [Vibrio europaeus]MDC5717812.1 flagellar export chaperone FlgN [Vibrio europaeus]MDC5718115.1 flagellar export chaperone FlgN [Vibrio europaeus]MDC5727687.1 flagellar export chaperone FlgN [Vibrio europaeus]